MIRDRDGCYGQAVTKRLAAIGIPRSPDRREVALAERACGETDRLDPPGMPRSHRRLRRGPPAPNPYGLQRLLQRPANTSVAGQGFAAPSIGPAPRQARRSADPRRAAPSILPDVVFSRDTYEIALNFSNFPDYRPSPLAIIKAWPLSAFGWI